MTDVVYFVRHDANGTIIEHLAAHAGCREMLSSLGGVQVTQEDYALIRTGSLSQWVVENGKIKPRPQTIDEQRDGLMVKIDAEAEQQRRRFLAPHPGQAQVHAMKLAEARWFIERGHETFSDTPFLNAEGIVHGDAGANGRFTTAQRIIDAAEVSRQGLATIESERIGVKIALRAADTADKLAAIECDMWAKWPSP